MLDRSDVAPGHRVHYRKWRRFYLDFCHKYGFESADRNSFLEFNNKLRDKRQSEWLRRQAHDAISLYYTLVEGASSDPSWSGSVTGTKFGRTGEGEPNKDRPNRRQTSITQEQAGPPNNVDTRQTDDGAISPLRRPAPRDAAAEYAIGAESKRKVDAAPGPGSVGPSSHIVGGQLDPLLTSYSPREPQAPTPPFPHVAEHGGDGDFGVKQSGASWIRVYNKLESSIKVRHYSPKTLEAYRSWIRQLQAFTKSKDPRLLSTDDVRDFLTFLAVKKKVSASSQNQAFNALLFLFTHVLEREFGKIEGVVRAKRKPYIPVVLSRAEVDQVWMAVETCALLVSSAGNRQRGW